VLHQTLVLGLALLWRELPACDGSCQHLGKQDAYPTFSNLTKHEPAGCLIPFERASGYATSSTAQRSRRYAAEFPAMGRSGDGRPARRPRGLQFPDNLNTLVLRILIVSLTKPGRLVAGTPAPAPDARARGCCSGWKSGSRSQQGWYPRLLSRIILSNVRPPLEGPGGPGQGEVGTP